jgi:hypothetical protein
VVPAEHRSGKTESRLVSGAATDELRSTPQGVAGKVLPAAGVALGPSLRFLEEA